jgi:hypothetical protein
VLDVCEWLSSRDDCFTLARETLCPLARGLVVLQSQFGRSEEEEKSLTPTGIRTLGHPARSLVSIPSELEENPLSSEA